MILDFAEGEIQTLEPTFLVLAVGGLGLSMRISLNSFASLKGKTGPQKVFTHLHYSQTDGFSLFGFSSFSERSLFLHLISVNGVGPGTALVALSSSDPDQLRRAIAREDVAAIQALKGIGPKTAQRLILELKDKIRKETAGGPGPASQSGQAAGGSAQDDALSALITLGIPRPAAEKALEALIKQDPKPYTPEELIRLVLQRSR